MFSWTLVKHRRGMKKHVKFEGNNFSRGIMHQISPRSLLWPDRSFGHHANGFGGVTREETTDSRITKCSPPRHMKDPLVATIQITTTLADAPFLQQSRLTPGQKHYLRTIAGVHSKEHVWKLLQQHYMNVAHRCIRTGLDSMTNLSVKASESLEPNRSVAQVSVTERETLPKILNKSGQKHLNKGKNTLPNIYNRHKWAAANNFESKKGPTRKSRISSDRTHFSTKGAGLSKPDVRKDNDDEDSLDELIRALSMEDDEDFFL
ncbi:family with sequence similarity 216 member A isoform X2 [Clupea harengus]|uniref:Family with sequence similarity 216 member A isoform X2 n=1 Tax=Clupea harengus TaxID=7950 RepID=A0A6P8G271_CLUHA|nr:family with sequence similarity 216 member A isoform X2 [Clupea harengus]